MLQEQDFDLIFNQFTSSANGQSGIKEVYNIMPFMTDEQIQIYNNAMLYINRYEVTELKTYIDNIIMMKKENRNLGFMPSVKNFMKYATLDEKVRNIKVSQQGGNE